MRTLITQAGLLITNILYHFVTREKQIALNPIDTVNNVVSPEAKQGRDKI